MSNSAAQETYGLFSTIANRKLVSKLENDGVKVFQFPAVETEKVVLDETSIKYLQNLTNFDWIIFPDVFAVDYFLQALEMCEIDFFELDALSVFALGEAVANRLRFIQLHADLIPNFIETESVFLTLSDFTSQKGLENLRFLLPKEILSSIGITKKLTENKADITELPIYRAKITDKREVSKLKVLLTGGAIDKFIFSSPTDLVSLKYLFSDVSIAEILSETEVSATDEVTFRALKEYNLKSKLRFQLVK
ncbi:MAG: uroporphyrinogen-III synthase [Acidobacteriota bacterium]|nr:uroporphyrinogen-III synthase [Acidobacteriota bacterium]